MTHDGLHWMTMVGTVVFVFAACAVLTLSAVTFAAVWVGRGSTGGPDRSRLRPPTDPDTLV
jgi:hypothetical protein